MTIYEFIRQDTMIRVVHEEGRLTKDEKIQTKHKQESPQSSTLENEKME